MNEMGTITLYEGTRYDEIKAAARAQRRARKEAEKQGEMNVSEKQHPTDAPQYKRCPDCGGPTEWGKMIWLDGRCTCPACYAERRRLDAREEERE